MLTISGWVVHLMSKVALCLGLWAYKLGGPPHNVLAVQWEHQRTRISPVSHGHYYGVGGSRNVQGFGLGLGLGVGGQYRT